MTRKEKYQFLRSIGLSAEQARKWRDRKIEQLESLNKDIILKNNKELKKELVNYENKKRYNFLRQIGLSSEKARQLRSHSKIDVNNLTMRNKKIVKNEAYNKLYEKVKNEYSNIYSLTIENDVKRFVEKYRDVENYGVYTKWGTITRIEPYKHETYELVSKIREIYGANEKQGFYILYLMYQHKLSINQINEIIKTDPLYEQYAKEGK